LIGSIYQHVDLAHTGSSLEQDLIFSLQAVIASKMLFIINIRNLLATQTKEN